MDNGLRINPNKSAVMSFDPNKNWTCETMSVTMNKTAFDNDFI